MRLIELQRKRVCQKWLLVAFLTIAGCRAAVINVTTNDSYAKLESARAGDEVIIAPGVYRYRAYFTAAGSPAKPIVIRAQDPANRPVWDLSGTLVENAPGSYTGGDRGRGGWQFSGASNYKVSGIIFSGSRNLSRNCAGIRYYNTSTNLYFKDCVFINNDNGITGGTQESDATVEFCEFSQNGNLQATAATHNIYVYGGTLALRYCYVHDSAQSQNFHIRCRYSLLEYNWLARAKNYEGDLMSDDDFDGSVPETQVMMVRGNIFVQSANPANRGQVLVIYNDSGTPNLSMSMQVVNNTFIGYGGNSAFMHISNADGTRMTAEVSNNIIFGTSRPTLIEDPSTGTITGVNNWIASGVAPGPLGNSIVSASPGFRNPAAQDYTLSPGSAAIAKASTSPYGLPGLEYFKDETTSRKFRARPSIKDLGAFESTTSGLAFGAYDAPPVPKVSALLSKGDLMLSWPLSASDYRLIQSTGLNSGAVWTQASGQATTNATGINSVLSAKQRESFFKLSKP
jgi:hypothetical protein